ncbi:MAG: hypothetical protein IMZ61_12990 [Planctomycetes bacterium]|nr:hypothetical protein [Planctomycetota bacterium]
MDNTLFTILSDQVGSIIGMALVAVFALAGLIMGAYVGYGLYKDFVDPIEEWKRGQYIRRSGKTEGNWRPFGH